MVAASHRLGDRPGGQRRARRRRPGDGLPTPPSRPAGGPPLRSRRVYTSLAFSARLTALELDQSFSAVGSCYDNAAVESFFATLKRELPWIHRDTKWATRA